MTILTGTKIIVADLERCSRFYRTVANLEEVQRVEGDGFTEVILRRADEAVLVFDTDDLAAMSARPVEGGGTVSQPATMLPELGQSYAMFADPEGHVAEGVCYQAGS